ncbi:hypothetical protein IT087_00805 [Candidatus Uhrbacteria bacterium]|nr:hypothetical protein [Candidatus Uhrbacteria bacterium]
MSDGGFLGGPAAVEQPKAVEVAQTNVEMSGSEAESQERRQIEVEQQKNAFLEQAQEPAPTTTVVPGSNQHAAAQITEEVPKDEITVEVEKILEYGLGDYIPDMPEEARQRFLKKGGEVAAQLSTMVHTLNVQVTLVVTLIKEWLLTIPGVNRYYIEQESKIKTDQIVELANVRRNEQAGVIPKA